MTKDGVMIAMHDKDFKRIGRGLTPEFAERQVSDMSWEEVRDIDTGSYLDSQYASTRLATMESVFAAMKGRPERLLYVDEKGAAPEAVAELARRFGVVGQIFFCSRNWKKVIEWRMVAPEGCSMVWLGIGPRGTTAADIRRKEEFVRQRLDEMEAFGFDGIDPVQIHIEVDATRLAEGKDPFCPTTPFLKNAVARLHKYGVSANAANWEGRNPEIYGRLWEMGFDIFTTDYPLALFPILERLKGAARRSGKSGGA